MLLQRNVIECRITYDVSHAITTYIDTGLKKWFSFHILKTRASVGRQGGLLPPWLAKAGQKLFFLQHEKSRIWIFCIHSNSIQGTLSFKIGKFRRVLKIQNKKK
jgi:hypothetical protein